MFTKNIDEPAPCVCHPPLMTWQRSYSSRSRTSSSRYGQSGYGPSAGVGLDANLLSFVLSFSSPTPLITLKRKGRKYKAMCKKHVISALIFHLCIILYFYNPPESEQLYFSQVCQCEPCYLVADTIPEEIIWAISLHHQWVCFGFFKVVICFCRRLLGEAFPCYCPGLHLYHVTYLLRTSVLRWVTTSSLISQTLQFPAISFPTSWMSVLMDCSIYMPVTALALFVSPSCYSTWCESWCIFFSFNLVRIKWNHGSLIVYSTQQECTSPKSTVILLQQNVPMKMFRWA